MTQKEIDEVKKNSEQRLKNKDIRKNERRNDSMVLYQRKCQMIVYEKEKQEERKEKKDE